MRRSLLSMLLALVAALTITGSAAAQLPPPVVVPADTPAGTFVPVVLGTDAVSAAQGVWVTNFVLGQVDPQFLAEWGYRPTRPVTVYLFDGGDALAFGYSVVTEQALTVPELELIASLDRVYTVEDQRTGGWGILVNLSPGNGTTTWLDEIRAVIYHGYAQVMIQDRAGTAGPLWYREGLAQLIAYANVPGAPSLSQRVFQAATFNAQGMLPSLGDLSPEGNWVDFTGMSPQARDAALGFSYLALNLMSPIGGLTLLDVLTDVQEGVTFEAALLSRTGYTVERLSDQTQLRMPSPEAVTVLLPIPLASGQPLPTPGVPALTPSLQEPAGPVPPANGNNNG